VRKSRQAKRITLRKLGQLVGLSPSYLSEIEHGRRLPPKDEEKIQDLAVVLNLDEDELIKAAKRERIKKGPKIFNKLFSADQDLAWGLYRAAEDASDDDIQIAFRKALESLKKGGKSG
jgi:transcriptional regulator with XRE-family HTH domain